MEKIIRWTLCILLSLVLLGGCSTSHDLSEDEKAVLMTEKDFANYSDRAGKSIKGQFKKTINYLNRSYQLEYKNDPKVAKFFVYSIVSVEDSVAKATNMEVSFRAGVTIGFKYGGMEEEPMKLNKDIGNHASLSLLKYQGKPAGNLLTTVIDKKTVVLMFTGIYFDNENDFHDFVDGYIAKVTRFSK